MVGAAGSGGIISAFVKACQVGESEDFFAVQGSAYLGMMRRALGRRPATSRPPAGRTRHDLPEASTAT